MNDEELADTTAQILLDTRSVLFRPNEPFFFSSGWASPVFVDCKRLISFPLARNVLIELSIGKILANVGYEALDVVAGGEVAGVPFAAIIADRLHLPLVIVRKQALGLGPTAQTEGVLEPGKRVLLVEDLTTDGRTKALFCNGLRKAGADVRKAFVIFKYGIFDHVVRDMDALGVSLFSLATWTDVLRVAKRRGDFDAPVLEQIESYVADPVRWSKAHGGIGAQGGG
jgi:orotate phosphoribosyltransferase